jgi:hypothetical protein
MHAFIRFLLCLTVAFQGIAYAHALNNPCPMAQTGIAMAMDENNAANNAIGDCCNDADVATKTGKLCKTGQDCSVSAHCVIASHSPSKLPVALSSFVPATQQFMPSFDPSGVWRPPSFS